MPRITRNPRTTAPYLAQPRQAIMHACPAQMILFGGAVGGGKSDALLAHGSQHCRDFQGARAIYFRRVTRMLRKPIMRARQMVYPQEARFNQNNAAFTWFDAGDYGMSEFFFSHMEHEDNALDHHGEEYSLILMDELTHYTEFMFMYIRSRNRTVVPEILAAGGPKMICGANPGGVGHNFVKKFFIDPELPEVEYVAYYDTELGEWFAFPPGETGPPKPMIVWRPVDDGTLAEENEMRAEMGLEPVAAVTRCFIPSLIQDNIYLYRDNNYIATLNELPADQRRALLKGDWSVYVGQVFKEFIEPLHTVQPMTIPLHWTRWRSVDWGYTKPMAVHWHAMDPATKQVHTYREMYVVQKSDADACKQIIEMTDADERPMIAKTMADPSMWAAQGRDDAESRAEAWRRHGVELTPANHERIAGKQRVHEMLRIDYETGRPRWVIHRNCTHLLRTLPALVYHDKHVEDVDTRGEDHAYDSIRYGFTSLPSTGDHELYTDTQIEAGRYWNLADLLAQRR